MKTSGVPTASRGGAIDTVEWEPARRRLDDLPLAARSSARASAVGGAVARRR